LAQPNGTPDKTETERQTALSKVNKEAKTIQKTAAKRHTQQ